MSEIGETFASLREEGRERRANNRESTPEVLRAHGVSFVSKNAGAHLIVTHGKHVADLWPGTGKYQVRGTGRYKRGVFNLLRDLGIERVRSAQ